MMEVGVLLDKAERPIYWHLPPNRSGGSLPDSNELWEIIWENRKNIWGFAHSHPGGGVPGPSYTDITTFAAIETALGVRLAWPIVSMDEWVICRWLEGRYSVGRRVDGSPEPEWVRKLRELSGFPTDLSKDPEIVKGAAQSITEYADEQILNELTAEAERLGLGYEKKGE